MLESISPGATSGRKVFRQVFIDDGAVTWPGEIDLAPDAMYAEISGKQKTTEFVADRR